jgi:hypothetical protein
MVMAKELDTNWEAVGECVDTLDNLMTAMKMNLPDELHLQALRESLPDLRTKLKAAYVAANDYDPW